MNPRPFRVVPGLRASFRERIRHDPAEADRLPFQAGNPDIIDERLYRDALRVLSRAPKASEMFDDDETGALDWTAAGAEIAERRRCDRMAAERAVAEAAFILRLDDDYRARERPFEEWSRLVRQMETPPLRLVT